MTKHQNDKNIEKPILIIDPEAHTDTIRGLACDAEGKWAITGSDDKTIRIWLLTNNSLYSTIRIQSGLGNIGRIYAVAISPDGEIIAAGGWTRYSTLDPHENVYLYRRESGELFKVIQGLPGTVSQLTFSIDGDFLFVGGEFGLRVFSSKASWTESGRDEENYICDGLDYSSENCLVTSSREGFIRLYLNPLLKNLIPLKTQVEHSVDEDQPQEVKFFHSVELDLIAIGFANRTTIEIRNGKTLKFITEYPIYSNLSGIYRMKDLAIERARLLSQGNLQTIAWSIDGSMIFAAGISFAIYGWNIPKYGVLDNSKDPDFITLGLNDIQVNKMITLPNGDLLVAGGRGRLGRLKFRESQRFWEYIHISENPLCELPYNPAIKIQKSKKTIVFHESIKVSSSGDVVDFFIGEDEDNAIPIRFDLNSRRLIVSPPKDEMTKGMKMEAIDGNLNNAKIGKLRICGWQQVNVPHMFIFRELDGADLIPLEVNNHIVNFESKDLTICLAAYSGSESFAIGCENSLRCINKKGIQLWKKDTPPVLGLNTAKGGELIIGIFADNTIRWYRNRDGQHLLSFSLLKGLEDWVAWTPEGFYGASARAYNFLQWHINKGWHKSPDSFPIHNISGSFRPGVLPLILEELDLPRALGLTIIKENTHRLSLRANKQLPEDKQLYLLAIGISEYKDIFKLRYGEKDANELSTMILNTQNGSLYSQVKPIVLLNQEATQQNIWDSLDQFNRIIENNGKKSDLLVFFFSGHGTIVNKEYYLVPYDIDNQGAGAIKSTGLSIKLLRSSLEEIASTKCQVLVLIDSCYSGNFTDLSQISSSLASENIAVVLSSHPNEPSFEDEKWEHGIFTKALLESFSADHGADSDYNGLITMTELSKFINETVAALSTGKQTVAMEIRHDFPVFATNSK